MLLIGVGNRGFVWTAWCARFFYPVGHRYFFQTDWKVHYNSDRTGVRLIGPASHLGAEKTAAKRRLHPSNIHDNAYAIGTVDFTGNMAGLCWGRMDRAWEDYLSR